MGALPLGSITQQERLEEMPQDEEFKDVSSAEVSRETGSHGGAWNEMHGGYFSSPNVAAPLVDKVTEAIEISRPQVIVDLGGGTGFVLAQVSKQASAHGVELLDLDLSAEQLSSLVNQAIIPRKGSILSFKRSDLEDPEMRFLYLSRSAFHYSGILGLKPFMRHIREQMREHELFVHQTACFGTAEDALMINILYEMLETDKWYPSLRIMYTLLEEVGFEVSGLTKAPTLALTSDSLMTRYNMDKERIPEIIRTVKKDFSGEKKGVFEVVPNGFVAHLHYMVYTCRAV